MYRHSFFNYTENSVIETTILTNPQTKEPWVSSAHHWVKVSLPAKLCDSSVRLACPHWMEDKLDWPHQSWAISQFPPSNLSSTSWSIALSPVKRWKQLGTVVHACNPNAWEADLCEFQASLVYVTGSRPARTTWWDPVSTHIHQEESICFFKKKIQFPWLFSVLIILWWWPSFGKGGVVSNLPIF